jgi:hypothetical protein
MQLYLDVGERPMVFIRFNPDGYKKRDGTKVTSCWSLDGFGMMVVKQDKQAEWAARLEALRLAIEYWSAPENRTNKRVEVVELFFDEN